MPYLPAYILFALSVAFLANAFLAQIDVGDGREKWQQVAIGVVFGVLFYLEVQGDQ